MPKFPTISTWEHWHVWTHFDNAFDDADKRIGNMRNLFEEEEEEEEEELSLSARAWGCWMSDSLWVGPPVSRAP